MSRARKNACRTTELEIPWTVSQGPMMVAARAFVLLACLLLALASLGVNAHMYLRSPLSRGISSFLPLDHRSSTFFACVIFFSPFFLLVRTNCHPFSCTHSPVIYAGSLTAGGETSAGGTAANCSVKTTSSSVRTKYVAGQTYNFAFRVNQHGPAPFAFALSTTGDEAKFDIVLLDNIANKGS